IQYDITGLRQYSDAAQKGGKVDATVKFRANGCSTDEGTIDGTIFENFRGTVPAPGTQPTTQQNDFAILVDAHITAATKAKGTIHADVDFEFASINGDYTEWFSVQVDDGNVVVSGTWNTDTKMGQI